MVKVRGIRMNRAKRANKSAPAKTKRVTVPALNAKIMKAITDYRRLLDDPCGAPMVNGPYMGVGSGYLTRTKQVFVPNGSTGATDFVITITPNGGSDNNLAQWGYSTTKNGSLGTAQSNTYPAFLDSSSVGYFRCIAGCAKILYTGSEMDRRGMVGTCLLTGDHLIPGETITGNTSDFLARCTRVMRLGEEAHEVRWLPSATDGFVSTTQPDTGGTFTLPQSTMLVVVQGCPVTAGAPAAQVEFTGVWEWVPDVTLSGGLVPDTKSPPAFTINTVLATIGDVARWATDPSVQAQASRFAKGVYNFTSKAATAMAAMSL